MSTRYVWTKRVYASAFLSSATRTNSALSIPPVSSAYETYTLCSSYTAGLNSYGKPDIIPSGNMVTINGNSSGQWSASTYPYFISRPPESGYPNANIRIAYTSGNWCIIQDSSGRKSIGFVDTSGTNTANNYDLKSIQYTSSTSTVSSSGSSTYPNGEYSTSQKAYFSYLGSDSIDAASTSSSSLKAGQSCNIVVSPGTNTYSGTISYLYQYSVNGGTWTTIATTSSTTQSFTVPSNATSIQFRTRAQDNWGFTSSTYVTSPSYTVTSDTSTLPPVEEDVPAKLNAGVWVGVLNTSRKVNSIYVGVNNSARKLKAGWIGINGNAKPFYAKNTFLWTKYQVAFDGYWKSVAYGNDKFVAISYTKSEFAYSTDGITWTASEIPFYKLWEDVSYGNGKFVAIAGMGEAVYSTDGITWSKLTFPGYNFSSITYGGEKFVSVGLNNNKVAYSSDGIDWRSSTLPISLYWRSVTYGNSKFVAVGGNDTVAYSTNGITWNKSNLPDAGYHVWNCVTFGNGKFVAITDDGKLAYSTDGISWTESTFKFSFAMNGFVTFGNGKFLATVDVNAAYSTDGIDWKDACLAIGGVHRTTYGNGKFVTVNDNNNFGLVGCFYGD